MSAVTQSQLEQTLQQFCHPLLQHDWLTPKAIKAIDTQKNPIQIELVLGFPCERIRAELQLALQQHLQPLNTQVTIHWQVKSHAIQTGLKTVPAIKNIIAIASGKGGVGKSTVTVNLALALVAQGAKVGILDADIYGPSQPMMLGVQGRPDISAEKKMIPLVAHQIPSMSIGYLVADQAPAVWRGPMVSRALQQLLNDTQWPELDYLLIDLPPGTGDIQLTLAQKIPVTGAVVVTTPQDIALLDVKKAVAMFEKVNVPVLGLVENMSVHICEQCGHQQAIFGEQGGVNYAAEKQIPLLAQLPLDIRLRQQTDRGNPTVAAEPDSDLSKIFYQAALVLTAQIALRPKDYSAMFPTIQIQKES